MTICVCADDQMTICVRAVDHSRIVLHNREKSDDYINASLVQVPEANRRYILTQVPLLYCVTCILYSKYLTLIFSPSPTLFEQFTCHRILCTDICLATLSVALDDSIFFIFKLHVCSIKLCEALSTV